jgi:hypothetical protein
MTKLEVDYYLYKKVPAKKSFFPVKNYQIFYFLDLTLKITIYNQTNDNHENWN